MELNSHTLIYAGVLVLLAIFAFNSLTVFQISGDLSGKIDEAKQNAAPPRLELTVINSSCANCSDVSGLVASLKELEVEWLNENILEGNSGEARELIGKFNIERLPAIIIEGEIAKTELDGFREESNALLFDSINAPYEEAVSGKIAGNVSAIILEDSECEACSDLGLFVNSLRQNEIFIGNEKRIEYNSDEGLEILKANGIGKIPALLLSSDIEAYPEILPSLNQIGSKSAKDFYVIESSAPYIEPDRGNLRGIVNITYLSDGNCFECYDVQIHKQILANFGVYLNEESSMDITSFSGKELIEKYGISKVPTVILEGDVEAYPQFEELWVKSLGTREDDGAYIFRTISALGSGAKFKEID